MPFWSGWSGVAVGLEVPAVDDTGGQHRRVLARAVHQDRRTGSRRVRMSCSRVVVVQGVVGWRLQRGLVEADRGEDAPRTLDVEGLARVRSAGQRQQVRWQVQTQAHHAERLERLVRRPRQDRRVDGPHRPVHGPVGRQGDQRSVVVALHESGTHDLGHDHRGRHGRRLLKAAGWQDDHRADPSLPAALPQPARARRPRAADERGVGATRLVQPARQPRHARAARRRAGRGHAGRSGRAGRPRGASPRAHRRARVGTSRRSPTPSSGPSAAST